MKHERCLTSSLCAPCKPLKLGTRATSEIDMHSDIEMIGERLRGSDARAEDVSFGCELWV